MHRDFPGLRIRDDNWFSEDSASQVQWLPERAVVFAAVCGAVLWAGFGYLLWLIL
jgi:hypothetical protein